MKDISAERPNSDRRPPHDHVPLAVGAVPTHKPHPALRQLEREARLAQQGIVVHDVVDPAVAARDPLFDERSRIGATWAPP